MTQEERLIAALRIRGPSGLSGTVEKTFTLLSLPRSNTLALMPSNNAVLGMLNKLKAYIVWGEVTKETLLLLLEKQRRAGNRSGFTRERMKEMGCDSFEALAEMIYNNPRVLKDLAARGFRALFQLHPPRRGFKRSTKALAGTGGGAGYIGAEINELISRMTQPG